MRYSLLVAALLLLAFTLATLLRSTHTSDDDDRPLDQRSQWLRLHPPRQAQHDAELLRRRTLSAIEGLNETELSEHVPQLVASLAHHDGHVRALALRMLRKLPSSAMEDHAETLVMDTLTANADDAVRLYVLQTLVDYSADDAVRLPTIASGKGAIVECLLDESSSEEVRRAAADVLALLEPEDLATYTEDVLASVRGSPRLAAALVSSWGFKLTTDACRARAGQKACLGALEELTKLAGTLAEGGTPGGR